MHYPAKEMCFSEVFRLPVVSIHKFFRWSPPDDPGFWIPWRNTVQVQPASIDDICFLRRRECNLGSWVYYGLPYSQNNGPPCSANHIGYWAFIPPCVCRKETTNIECPIWQYKQVTSIDELWGMELHSIRGNPANGRWRGTPGSAIQVCSASFWKSDILMSWLLNDGWQSCNCQPNRYGISTCCIACNAFVNSSIHVTDRFHVKRAIR